LEEQDRLLSDALGFPKVGRRGADNEFRPVSPNASQTVLHPQLATRSMPRISSSMTDCIIPLRPTDNRQPDTMRDSIYPTNNVNVHSQLSPRQLAYASDPLLGEGAVSLSVPPHRSSQIAPCTHNSVGDRSQPGGHFALPAAHSLPEFVPFSQSQPENSAFESRIRDYQNRLLQRQPDRQKALMEARLNLQQRARQLLDVVPPLIVPPNNSTRERPIVFQSNVTSTCPSTIESNFHSPTVTTAARSISDGGQFQAVSQPYSSSNYEDFARSSVTNVDSSQCATMSLPTMLSQKTYHYQLYDNQTAEQIDEWNNDYCRSRKFDVVNTTSELVSHRYSTDVVEGAELDKLEDDREFITPEMRPDDRQQLCRPCDDSIAQFFARSSAVQFTDAVTPSSSTRIPDKSDDDGFNSRVLQAQRGLEERQRRMQEQLAALENEERLLMEEQRRIEEQIGNFRALPSDNRGDQQRGDETPCELHTHLRHIENEDEHYSSEQASIVNSYSSQLSTSIAEMVHPTTFSIVQGQLLNSTAIDTNPVSSNQYDSAVSGAPVCSTAAGSEEHNRHRVGDSKFVPVSEPQFRNAILLDTYASSHSDLLGLLAEGNLPSLSGLTSPTDSWNVSYGNFLSRRDDSSYQLLPELPISTEVKMLLAERTSLTSTNQSEKIPNSRQDCQFSSATGSDDDISEQYDGESTSKGSVQSEERSRSQSAVSAELLHL